MYAALSIFFLTQIENDAVSPGSKARIIHKESDIITAFAVNKVYTNGGVGGILLEYFVTNIHMKEMLLYLQLEGLH